MGTLSSGVVVEGRACETRGQWREDYVRGVLDLNLS